VVKSEKILRKRVDFWSTLWHPPYPKGHNFGGAFNAKRRARPKVKKQGTPNGVG